MVTDLETMCDTPGCLNRVRRYPWNASHRRETRYCIPCALERQQSAGQALVGVDAQQDTPAGQEIEV